MSGAGWSEDRVHRWLARRSASSVLVNRRGNDAAVLRIKGERLVTCADQTIEGVHFESDAPPRAVGAKAVVRALSDLAATAALPVGVLVTLCAPASTSERWIRSVLAAAAATAQDVGAELLGGDLASAPGSRALSVSALGRFPFRGRPPGRERARPGDVLVVTGPLGGSRLGRHLRIRARLAEGAWLYRSGARAMMDVTDGLALDLSRLARASGVRIELDRIPVHRDARRAARESGRSSRAHALTDGEDHELVASLPLSAWRRAERAAQRRFPRLVCIGHVRRGSGLWYVEPGGAGSQGHGNPVRIEPEGWLHGAS